MEGSQKFHLKPNPRLMSNFFSKITFLWTASVFDLGSKKEFEETDLFQPLLDHKSGEVGPKLESIWNDNVKKAQINGKEPSLVKALIACFGKEFISIGFVLIINELVIRVAQPMFLGWLIAYFTEEKGQDSWDPYLYSAMVVLLTGLSMWLHHPCSFYVLHLGMKVRVAACSLAYRKLLRLNRVSWTETTPGQIVNLLSNDVKRFDTAALFVHYLWLGPLQTMVILGLLINEIGILPSIAGVASLLINSPLQGYFGKKASVYRLKVAERTDKRVHLINGIISGIQVIKMYAWELPFESMISKARRAEMREVLRMNHIRGNVASFVMFSTRLAVFIAMLTFALQSEDFSALKAFTVTAYFYALHQSMINFFPQGITQLAEGLVTVRRLQKFLVLPETKGLPDINLRSSNGEIILDNVSAKWAPDQIDFTLATLSMKISPGSLIAIVGPVGAGKSSVLNALLAELPLISGSAHVGGTVAYASQEPWLFEASVRQNILFGEDMDLTRYNDVVHMCALQTDFSLFPRGDTTLVGERGVSLSGGQRARINLARALYRKADIYLLDDPLSAVDAHVSSQLFNYCIKKFLKGKTRILVTHQLQYLPDVDHIFVMDNGRLVADGSYEQVKDIALFSLMGTLAPESPACRTNELSSRRSSMAPREHDNKTSSKSKAKHEGESSAGTTRESRFHGSVKWQVFKSYLMAAGTTFYVGFVLLFFVWCQLCASVGDYWITIWIKVEQQQHPNLNQTLDSTEPWYLEWPANRSNCIHVYSAIIIATIVATILRSVLFFDMCARSSCRLHDGMFTSVTRARMRFFNTNSSGRILNRFTKDMGAIDEVLPTTVMDGFQVTFTLIAVVTVVLIINYWLFIPFIILTLISLWIRRVYMMTSISIKRLEGVTRSPVFSHINASVSGLTTVRALRMEAALTEEFDRHQDLHSSASFLLLGTNRAFAYWLDQVSLMFITVVTFSFLTARNAAVFGGDVGLAITQAMYLTGQIQWGMRQEAEIENQMTCVERVLEYSSLQHEAEPPFEYSTDKKVDPSWPALGKIHFENVSLLYNTDNPPVLRNLTVTFNAGEKIGIVGRTGAGKTSLINAMFRLENVRGQITIDGVDTAKIGIHTLRKKLSIIPQESVLFNATLRKNLDPFDEHADEALWSAIREVELLDFVQEMGDGLQFPIQEGGANLSGGQRQLVCLARAILHDNRILVLDEATANVDPHTDDLIQNMIRMKFKHCTVLTIAHRLHTIMDSDKILVMDEGCIMEYDHPHLLLQHTNGYFYKMVEQIGGEMSKKLAKTAEENYKAWQLRSQDDN